MNYLGDPDNGVIVGSYIGGLLMAGGFLAIGSCVSAATKSQVIAFVISLMICLGFSLAGFSPVLDFFKGWVPWLIEAGPASASFPGSTAWARAWSPARLVFGSLIVCSSMRRHRDRDEEGRVGTSTRFDVALPRSVETTMNTKVIGIGGLILLVALFFGINILAGGAVRSSCADLQLPIFR